MAHALKPINTLVADSVNPGFKSSDYDLSNLTDVQASIDALANANRAKKTANAAVIDIINQALDALAASADMNGFGQFLTTIAGIVRKDATATLSALQETDTALKAALALHTALKAVDQDNTAPSTVLAHVNTFAHDFLPGTNTVLLGGPVDMSKITRVTMALEDENAEFRAQLGKITADQKVATAEVSINAMLTAVKDTTRVVLAGAGTAPVTPTIAPKKELDLTVGTYMDQLCAIMEAYAQETKRDLDYGSAVKYLSDCSKGGNSLKTDLPGWNIKL